MLSLSLCKTRRNMNAIWYLALLVHWPDRFSPKSLLGIRCQLLLSSLEYSAFASKEKWKRININILRWKIVTGTFSKLKKQVMSFTHVQNLKILTLSFSFFSFYQLFHLFYFFYNFFLFFIFNPLFVLGENGRREKWRIENEKKTVFFTVWLIRENRKETQKVSGIHHKTFLLTTAEKTWEDQRNGCQLRLCP